MDNRQLALAYAIVCSLGYDKPIADFKSQVTPIYESALKELGASGENSVDATKNPFRTSNS